MWWLSFFSLPNLVFGVFGGGLMVYAHLVVVSRLEMDFAHFGVVGGGLHFSCDLSF